MISLLFMRSSLIMLVIFCLYSGCSSLKKIDKGFYSKRAIAIKDREEKYSESIVDDQKDFIICEWPVEAQTDWEDWNNYLQNQLVLDSASLDSIPAGTYRVFIQFAIDTKGKITNISAIKDPGYGLGQRAADVISKYTGRWKPAELGGHNIQSCRKQPITFIVEEEEECKDPLLAKLIL